MRIVTLLTLAVAVIFSAGCAGPERKLGRGMLNASEILRGGEMRRSLEQTMLWDNTDSTYTTGFLRGLHRTMARTGIGLYEIVTFPIPSYEPMLTSTNRIYPDYASRNRSFPFGGMVLTEFPTYPDNYRPGIIEDSTFATDTSLGFSGGDVVPFMPGSRFRVFDN